MNVTFRNLKLIRFNPVQAVILSSSMHTTPATLDIFTQVIDNYGDAGVSWRFARLIARRWPHTKIRLFIDVPSIFCGMIAEFNSETLPAQYDNVKIYPRAWLNLQPKPNPAHCFVEMFGCEVPAEYIAASIDCSALWLNVEYLSAEPWVEECHEVRSLRPFDKPEKYFLHPGFTTATGGLLFDECDCAPIKPADRSTRLHALLKKIGILLPEETRVFRTIALFTYTLEVQPLLQAFSDAPTTVLVLGEQTRDAFLRCAEREGAHQVDAIRWTMRNCLVLLMPMLKQEEFDTVITSVDFPIVRGEDSWVRAVIAGRPFLWNIYPQHDDIHFRKLEAFIARVASFCTKPDLPALETWRCALIALNTPSLAVDDRVRAFRQYFASIEPFEGVMQRFADFLKTNCNFIDHFCSFVGRKSETKDKVV